MIGDVKIALRGTRCSTELSGRSAIVTKHTEQRRKGQSPSLGFKQSVQKSWTLDNRGICGNCGSPQELFFNNWFDKKTEHCWTPIKSQQAMLFVPIEINQTIHSSSLQKQWVSASLFLWMMLNHWLKQYNCDHHTSRPQNLQAHSGNLCSSATIVAVRPR